MILDQKQPVHVAAAAQPRRFALCLDDGWGPPICYVRVVRVVKVLEQ